MSFDVAAAAGFVLVAAFFALRPGLWQRLLFDRVDPRPAALLRIVFGSITAGTIIALMSNGRFLFSDEGLWTTELARQFNGHPLRWLWDAEQGFEHLWSPLRIALEGFSVLHLRSDPAAVTTLGSVSVVALLLMIAGVRTRVTTIVAWILVGQFYRHSGVYQNGGDYVTQVFFFLALFARWGEAWSIDAWLARRRGGAARAIPAWPQRLMMLQLALLYCVTGLLKSGPTWRDGSAMYYALNSEHFYRIPAMNAVAYAQAWGVLPTLTRLVHWWEMLFPLALVGTLLHAYERARRDGEWDSVPRWRRRASWVTAAGACAAVAPIAGLFAAIPAAAIGAWWLLGLRPRVRSTLSRWLLGRRVWLLFGVGMHVGIEATMNVGNFAWVTLAVYLAWLRGEDLDRAGAMIASLRR